MRNIRIGDYLVEQKLITPEQLEKVLAAQKESQGSKRFGDMVVEMGFISEVRLAQALAGKLRVPYVVLGNIEIDEEAVRKIPENLAKKYTVIAINIQEAADTDTIEKNDRVEHQVETNVHEFIVQHGVCPP